MSAFATIFNRNFVSTWSAPIWIFVALLQPFFWVFVFGQLFKPVPVVHRGQVFDYLSYFGPGILAATTVFGALWAGIGFGMDRKSGMLSRFRLACKSDGTILAAYVLQSLSGVLAQAGVVFLLIGYLGAGLNWSMGSLFQAFCCVTLLAFTISALSHLLVVVIPDEMALIHINGFVSLPLLFLSSVLFPISDSPGWLRTLAQANPLHHAAEILRVVLIDGYDSTHLSAYVALLGVSGALLFGLAAFLFKRQKIA
ncbi:ABC transporter permease [Eilatimonas milleporae]|uniref:Transport permease protein n=1 Tax=Eilatimonas milleporae TaxID=911205 RepID=A0A3M0CWX7_9PROT|nr:ABC transporter permease [Eilatimonas milleporae]RMB11959.1 ABC-2 type transport system permease protein [Eilatimonas milleporae]